MDLRSRDNVLSHYKQKHPNRQVPSFSVPVPSRPERVAEVMVLDSDGEEAAADHGDARRDWTEEDCGEVMHGEGEQALNGQRTLPESWDEEHDAAHAEHAEGCCAGGGHRGGHGNPHAHSDAVLTDADIPWQMSEDAVSCVTQLRCGLPFLLTFFAAAPLSDACRKDRGCGLDRC